MPDKTQEFVWSYLTDEYLSRGMSYGDILQILSNHVTVWSALTELADLAIRSGLTDTDRGVYLARLVTIRDMRREQSDSHHNQSVRDFGRCLHFSTCWACLSRKSERSNIQWERTDQPAKIRYARPAPRIRYRVV